jgi:hypothetical protein
MLSIKKIILARARIFVLIIIFAGISFGLYWSISLLYEAKTNDVFGVASLVANIATVFAMTFLGLQVRNSNRSQNLAGANYLFNLLNNAEAGERRRVIYTAYKRKPDLGELQADALRIVVDLDQVSAMVKEGLFPKKIAFRMYSLVAIQCWKALEKFDFINKQRKKRNQPLWAQDFAWFYDQCIKYRKKKYPDENPDLYLEQADADFS